VSFQILDEYFSRGGNFLDTANAYDGGGSEKVIGLWLLKKRDVDGIRDIRDKIIIGTKCFFGFGDDVNQKGLSRRAMFRSCEESLNRLQTDYIDLLICHSYDNLTPLDETLWTFNQLIVEGKIRYWGVSNWPAFRIAQAVERCRANGWITPCNAQMQYSLISREIELDVVDVCIEYGIAITAWSPLAGGWLTGRIRRDNTDTDIERAHGFKNMGLLTSEDKAYSIIEKLLEVSTEINRPPSQISLRYIVDYNPRVQVIPIIGSAKLNHLSDGMDCETFTLSKESIDALHEVSKNPIPYPNNFYQMMKRKVDHDYYNPN
jgi:aryl-alcohol dehydrogenase-like predicted oxidoreductase